ncbi:MAG TPA: hypothetical protein VEH27_15405 [Methylomirabilota bacterium]|nr:hypothetical protein [Methylomirabilota bacterium]
MPRPLLNPRAFLAGFALPLMLFFCAPRAAASAPAAPLSDKPAVLLVFSAPGEDAYTNAFNRVAQAWAENCKMAGVPLQVFGADPAATNDLEQLRGWLKDQPTTGAELWLVFHGHGTFDNREGKFNLRGPDLSATELGALLQPFQRPLVVVLGFSSSAAFMGKVAGKDRVVLSATRSGAEVNYTRFGEHFADVACRPEGDLDKDGQTSALEAFLMAARRTAEFYSNNGRLMTEHALVDDNGDGVGTPPDFFKGVRAAKKAAGSKAVDGSRALQIALLPVESERGAPLAWRQKRDALEMQVEQLRGRKETMERALYYKELEQVLVQLSHLYAELPEPSPREARAE